MWIRDQGWKKFGSGINIPDPQHWAFLDLTLIMKYFNLKKGLGHEIEFNYIDEHGYKKV